jgi:hypothetical protein
MRATVIFVTGLLLISIAARGGPVSPGASLTQQQTPVALAKPPDTLPKAEFLSSPEVRTLLGYTRRPLHLPDGHTIGLFSFSFSAPANWLFLVDCRDMSVGRYAMPNNDIGSHGAALGADGNIYVMSYGTGRAYRFDTVAREFSELSCDIPEGQYAWDAIGGRNGRIYFGTYPGAWFGEFDPASGSWNIWKEVVPDTKYVGAMSALDDGRIKFKANGPAEAWMTFDPATRVFAPCEASEGNVAGPVAPALPAPETPDDSFETPVAADGRWFTVSRLSSRVYELFFDSPPKMVVELKAKAETIWWLKTVPGGLAGVGYYGAQFRLDLTSGEWVEGQLDNRAPGGNGIMFVEAISPECIVGANYSQQNLFTVNPKTGETMASLAKIARVPGEAMCAVGLNGVAYLGIYIQTVIAAYDPAMPLSYGRNPKELGHFGPQYQQTRPRAAVTDGQRVYFTSDSDYNHLGGALILYDPATEHFDVHHHVIPDQNLPTLVYDADQKLLWGGTDRWGQMRSAPPTQGSALIYAFDPDQEAVVHSLVPWPGADMVNVHGITRDGVLLTSNNGEVACIDTRTRKIQYQGPWPIPVNGMWRLGRDGMNYGLADGVLYRWDSTNDTITPVASAPGATMLTESEAGTWILASATSVFRVRISPLEESR